MWSNRKNKDDEADDGLVLVHALDGFLSAGSAPSIAAKALTSGHGEVVHRFDIDAFLDYRARRPSVKFIKDHYADYDTPRLDIVREVDLDGRPYFVLHGPEPDYAWERFAAEFRDAIEDLGIDLTLSLGAVPMGVPHTRPQIVTSHATRSGLLDHVNLWKAELLVPSSAQSMLEFRLGQWGHDAGGFVAHVPSYLANVDYPTAAKDLVEATLRAANLRISLDDLLEREVEALADIERQIADQGGDELIHGLEQQYDAFTRGMADSLLADEGELPSGDELAKQFEAFLARQRKQDD